MTKVIKYDDNRIRLIVSTGKFTLHWKLWSQGKFRGEDSMEFLMGLEGDKHFLVFPQYYIHVIILQNK